MFSDLIHWRRYVSGRNALDALEVAADCVACFFQIVIRLQPQPKPLTGTENTRQPHGSIRADAALAKNDLVDAARWHAGCACERVLADAHRNQEFFEEHLAGVNVWQSLHDRVFDSQ